MQIQTQTNPEASSLEPTADAPVERAETRAHMRRVTPAVDIFENAEELLLLADLPGVRSDAVELRVERGTLALTAEDPARGRVYRRAFALSDSVDPSGVAASLDKGVLSVQLPKRDDMKPRRVPVRAS